ncbi:response regulator [Sneathiella chungangensis]|uniref:Response regulator n=1 Tax=Sneathiella chungangensis TaxID=1418234 RepID=A0A845MJP5_9PROT|nr:response regulator transcription factor [Sneathiella chungangensis]MZR23174.1 response regulator [Sneathiella chungangensis]
MKILLIEDDVETANYIKKGLLQEGYTVDWVADGRDGVVQGASENYNLIITDRMLPALDGLSIVKSLRSAKIDIPILILTAVGGIDDRVQGLDAGADDYLVKPFSFAELSARCAALLRRPPLQSEVTQLVVRDLRMDLIRRVVTRGSDAIILQPREFQLLEYLMRNASRVVTKTMLLESVWDFHFDPKTNVVETHISRLRSKIDGPYETKLLHTIRGTGYVLSDD